ncbi:dihydroorotase [Helicobacter winghamensis]|uniref:Dihydroorotase n=2 Tax=Helicobacter winghamensis TaxID=157268 RepID=A0A2N3PJW0_9HELI|nr:dihydroorotase [Helicobacter winghamensis]EEO26308.1 dihydroorotase, homodimeric type [Helicobacter winghamensis ATCC BAA-430]PKT77295.1 dihydroorotase [Helicobacter winghamensis]PKT77495.1 dihydroorotase [Helicobacter winghamensis]PKT77772.1 dihydroorotase [Helicobacter winghamensis]PKT81461.1 dihydroorotase [Helicobacter winghamensis]
MIQLQSPYDMHLHLRDGEMLQNVAKYTAKYFSGALVMPNLTPPITSIELALSYKERIQNACGDCDFNPLMSLYLTEELNKSVLEKAREVGIVFLKLYPKGATTGSESGVSKVLDNKILEILEISQELGMFLSIHGESNGFSLDREVEFHPVFRELAESFPRLKIIFEHLSDHRSIALVEKYDNLFATLTLHHIALSLDDVLGGGLNPHHFCKPILKTPKDRDALLEVALNAHSKFSFGSDSAPHLRENKECAKGAAGIFSAPLALLGLAELFEKHNKLENLQSFVSDNARRIYDLPKTNKIIKLVKAPFEVPQEFNGIVPLFAGKTLAWNYA